MADPYIDKFETILYGRFSAAQILALLIGLDPDLDGALQVMSNRITAATDAMEAALKKAGDLDDVTYTSTSAGPADPVANARRVLRQAVNYAGSRDDGDAIVKEMLRGDTIGTVVKRRPVKLAGALGNALAGIEKHKSALTEHADWTAKLTAAKKTLDTLNESVRKARTDRRAMTPEIAATRDAWLVVYGSAKDIVSGVLRGKGRLSMLHEVFDDLAEVHRVAGVTDDAAGGGEPGAPA